MISSAFVDVNLCKRKSKHYHQFSIRQPLWLNSFIQSEDDRQKV